MNPTILRIAIDDADRAALDKALRPIRNSPKLAWGFGIVGAVLLVAFLIAAKAPWTLIALMPVVSIAVAALFAQLDKKRIQKIDADLATGTIIEVKGVLEQRIIASGGTVNTRFRWRVSGHEYALHRRFWHNAKNGQHVRLAYLEGSGLVFIAQPLPQPVF
jgi:hypothetical protein